VSYSVFASTGNEALDRLRDQDNSRFQHALEGWSKLSDFPPFRVTQHGSFCYGGSFDVTARKFRGVVTGLIVGKPRFGIVLVVGWQVKLGIASFAKVA